MWSRIGRRFCWVLSFEIANRRLHPVADCDAGAPESPIGKSKILLGTSFKNGHP